MKPTLMLTAPELFYRAGRGEVGGPNPQMLGDCSGLTGNCSGLWGNCTRMHGNLDACDATPIERAAGIDIRTLIDRESTE